MGKKYIASVSFGKDSLAMLFKLLYSEKYRLDEVVFYDTGMEFNAIYKIRDKIKKELSKFGIKYTELRPKETFEYMMFEKIVNHRNGTKSKGYSWCGGACRWGTTYKTSAIDKYCGDNIQYVGIAIDEPKRLEKLKKQKNKRAPLVDFGMSEKDCLEYCHECGYYWEESGVELYDILDRVSCWCCANKNLKELENYKKHLPEYWEKLKNFQKRTNRPFKGKNTIFDIEDKINGIKRNKKEVWLNVYNYNGNYIWGSDLYISPEYATHNLADKEHYIHTINIATGEIVTVDLKG